MHEDTKIIDGTNKEMDTIAGRGGEYGWTEEWGQEIVTKHIVPKLTKDDVVVDLCSGGGRASMPFSMRGAKVIAVDRDESNLSGGDEIRSKADAKPVERIVKDIKDLTREDLNGGATIIIAADALNHFSKKEADAIIKNIPNLLKPNTRGLVYINVPSTKSMHFLYPGDFNATKHDDRTLIIECGCSGELKEEFLPFYNEGEIQAILALMGATIIATNEIERDGCAVLNEVVAEFKGKEVE